MKLRTLLGLLALSVSTLVLVSCNDDDDEFSSSQIRQALYDMEGTYHGEVQVAYYHGKDIVKLDDAVTYSGDSLWFTMPLQPMAELVGDESIAAALRAAGEVTVTAGYDFTQMDDGNIVFGLSPKDVVILGGLGVPPTLKIVFAQTFGGDASVYSKSIMFNISPKELWANGEKYEDFTQLVYHFRGTCE